MKHKLMVSLGIGVLLSGFAIYFSFRNVPLQALWEYLQAINYVWIVPDVCVIAAAFVLRAVRWRMILSTTVSVDFRTAYHPLTIGFMLNCILPGRIGEAARPLILNRKEGVSFATGLATVAAERIFDAGFLIIFLAIAMSTLPMDSSLNITYGKYHLGRETLEMLGLNLLRLCIFLVAGVFLVAFDKTRNILNRIIEKSPDIFLFFLNATRRSQARLLISAPIVRLLNHASEGLMLFKSPRKMVSCSAVTLVIWFLTALSYYVMAIGCPGLGLSFYEFTLVMVIICFFIALPSVPGYWGIWEAGGVFALSLFGVSSQAAAGFTLANHAVQLAPVVFMGLLSTFSLSINIRQISKGIPSR